jgi:general secretion pathway protein I
MLKQERGFSLLEVLVAFVILGLVLGTLMQIFSGGLRNVTRASESQRAVMLAQSKLAAVGIEMPLAEGQSNGDFDANFRWQVSIRPYQDSEMETMEQAGVPKALLPVTLLEVEVRVLWGEFDQVRAVSLKTLRLANKVAL